MIQILIVSFLVLAFAEQELYFSRPDFLSKSFPNGVENKPALFGAPPHGIEIPGKIVYPISGFRDGCNAFNFSDNGELPDASIIALLERGTCTFVTKVLNAQYAGAKAVVIMNNNQAPLPLMADDGKGSTVSIPSIIISKDDGDRITNALSSTPVYASLSWGVPHKDNLVEWRFYTSSYDKNGIDIKKAFAEVSKSLGENEKFEAHYFFLKGKDYGCEMTNEGTLPCGNQCTNQGRYCAVDPEHDIKTGIDGADVVRENLRQVCIFQEAQKKGMNVLWWNYVNAFEENCSKAKETFNEKCSFQQATTIGINSDAIQTCISSSNGYGDDDGPNELMDKEIEARRQDGVYLLPSILINTQFFRKSLTCPTPADVTSCGVLAEICTGFSADSDIKACQTNQGCPVGETRDACGHCLSPSSPDRVDDREKCAQPSSSGGKSGGVSAGAVIGIVLFVVTFVAVGFFFMHRRSQANMRRELADIMQQYVPLGADEDMSSKAPIFPSSMDSSTY